MKKLLSYISVLSVGLMMLCSTVKAQSSNASYVSHLSSHALSNAAFSATSNTSAPSLKPLPQSFLSIQASLVYITDLSEAIDQAIIAFNQKNSESGFTDFTDLDADQIALKSFQKTNSRDVQLYLMWLTQLLGNYSFSPNVKALTKLPYELIGNWGVSVPSGG